MSWYTLASARSASMGLRSRSLTRPTIFRWDLTQREAMERLRYATLNLARGCGEMNSEFVDRIRKAVAIAKQKGAILNADAVVGQAALESAWGRLIRR